MSKLTDREILLITEYYIGVDGGYLGSFHDRRTLEEFYQVDCDLDINPFYEYDGSIREEFIEILKCQSARGQARILRTVLERFHCGSPPWHEPKSRQEKLRPRLEEVACRLEDASEMVSVVSPVSQSETVKLALEEAEHSVGRGRVSSAVDRMHTALHAHLKDLCDKWQEPIEYEKDASLTRVFKLLRQHHPAFHADGPCQQDFEKMLQGLASALDGLNTIRNHASLSHRPDTTLLEEAEATLAINAARSIFHFVEDKIQHLFSELNQAPTYSTVDNNAFEDTSPAPFDDIPF